MKFRPSQHSYAGSGCGCGGYGGVHTEGCSYGSLARRNSYSEACEKYTLEKEKLDRKMQEIDRKIRNPDLRVGPIKRSTASLQSEYDKLYDERAALMRPGGPLDYYCSQSEAERDVRVAELDEEKAMHEHEAERVRLGISRLSDILTERDALQEQVAAGSGGFPIWVIPVGVVVLGGLAIGATLVFTGDKR